MTEHPTLQEIERLLPAARGEEARHLAHLLLCEECAARALQALAGDFTELLEPGSLPRAALLLELPAAGRYPELIRRSESFLRATGTDVPPALRETARTALADERDRASAALEAWRSAPFRRLKREVARMGSRIPWRAVAEALLKLGHLTVPESPAQARNLARLALFAGERAALPELSRQSLAVEALCLLGDSLRRLGRPRSAERAFLFAVRHMAQGCEPRERAYFLDTLAKLREQEKREEEALAIAILEKVRVRFPELEGSEEMASLHLLEGKLLSATARPALAEARLRAAFQTFLRLGLLREAAAASLCLASLLLALGEEERLHETIEETVGRLAAAGLPPGLRGALLALRDAVLAGRATLTLINALLSYLARSEAEPDAGFIPPHEREPGR